MKERKFFANKRRQLKSGSYILIVTVIVLAVVIALNAVVAALPSVYTEIDISEKKLYTIGDVTEGYVAKLNTDVEFFYIVEADKEDKNVTQMLSSYADLSSYITYKTVDPAVDPKFSADYTSEEVKSGSVIVNSDKRSTVISATDMYRYSVEGYGEMSYDEFNDLYMSFYYGGYSQYGYTFPEYSTLFYGEQEFTSAIDYVTTDVLPKLCALTGHGETDLGDTYKRYISVENYIFETLSLLVADIPVDTQVVIINLPNKDLTEDEAAKLTEFVKTGGDLIVVTSCDGYTEASMPNLASVLAVFGMKAEEGLVCEGDSNYIVSYNTPYFFIPQFGDASEQSPVSKLSSRNYGVMFAYAHGIVESEAENVTFTEVLYTSDEAVIYKSKDSQADVAETEPADTAAETADTSFDTIDSGESDETATDTESADTESAEPENVTSNSVEGKATVAAASQYEGGGKVVWYASESITDEDWLKYGNPEMFIATLNWFYGKTENISIIGKELSVETFTTTASLRTGWTIFLCVVVPAAVLGVGLGVWAYRRRR